MIPFSIIAIMLCVILGRVDEAHAQTAPASEPLPAPSSAQPSAPEVPSPEPEAQPAAPTAAPAPAPDTQGTPKAPDTPTPEVTPEATPKEAPTADDTKLVSPKEVQEEHWYDKIHLRGYTQFRYNNITDDKTKLENAQGDRYLNAGRGFSIRRARLILYGDIAPRVYVYFQTDFASVFDTQGGIAIVRDWYTDLAFDKAKTFRARVGTSKVPFGFENMQSSQNRLALDRDDAINSAAKDERDLGIFLYYAPAHIRERFKLLVDDGLKGSGDYGALALGVYNGQGLNKVTLPEHLHGVARVNWPFQFGKQYVEIGAAGYYGKFDVSTDDTGTYTTPQGSSIKDGRANVSLIVYPQPFGFQTEWTAGVGPSTGDYGTNSATEIKQRALWGGYVQLFYKIDVNSNHMSVIPFARGQYYDGGKKFDTNTPHYLIKELDLGVEWQIIKALEFTLEFDMDKRTTSKAPYNQLTGYFLRAQLQVNY